MGLLPFPTLMVRDVQHVEILSLPKLAIYFRTFEYSSGCCWCFFLQFELNAHVSIDVVVIFSPDDILFKYNSVRSPSFKGAKGPLIPITIR